MTKAQVVNSKEEAMELARVARFEPVFVRLDGRVVSCRRDVDGGYSWMEMEWPWAAVKFD